MLRLFQGAAGELHGAEAFQAQLDGGPAGGVHAGVGADHEVCGELFAVLAQEGQEVRAALLLLALEEVLQVDGELVELAVGLLRLYVGEELALVVADAAAVEPAVADFGVIGVGVPELQRALGHHVVVAVNQKRGGVLNVGLHLADYDGVAAGQGVHAVGYAGLLHDAGEELGALGQALVRHAHALVLYERDQLVHVIVQMGFDVVVNLFEIVHAISPLHAQRTRGFNILYCKSESAALSTNPFRRAAEEKQNPPGWGDFAISRRFSASAPPPAPCRTL